MKRKLTLIPSATIHPNKICIYNQVHWDPGPPQRSDMDRYFNKLEKEYAHLLTSSRTAEGKVSPTARRKMQRSLTYLLTVSNNKKMTYPGLGRKWKYKISFITLTLPSQQIDSDNIIKSKCLNSFLIEIKKYYKVKHYIWRAEKQKNGNLHFHIITDKFIPYQELRDRWNRIINKLGYVDRYRASMKEFHKNGFQPRTDLKKNWPIKKQRQAYYRGKKTDWNSPNSTDIHSVQKITNIGAYISKYLTKNDGDEQENSENSEKTQKQTGRIWGCNIELGRAKGAKTEIDSKIETELKQLEKNGKVQIYEADYFTVIFVDWRSLEKMGCELLFKLMAGYLHRTFNYSIQTEAALKNTG